MIRLTRLAACFALLMLLSCGKGGGGATDASRVAGADSSAVSAMTPVYAKGFKVTPGGDGVTLLEISDPEGAETHRFNIALVDRGTPSARIPDGYTRVDVPVDRVVCMTSLQLSNFIKLGLTEKVAGVTSTRHLHNAQMRRQLEEGTTSRIGIEGNFDPEVVMALQPDLILISPFKRGGYEALKGVDAPMVPHLGYKELTPLGQAEWIKVVGLLTGHERETSETFAAIEKKYNALKAITDTVAARPTVFTGEMRGGNWYAVGGKSFLAQLIRDAGGDYFLKDNSESGGVTLDYETVYSQAVHSDYWRIVNSFEGDFDYEVLGGRDARYKDFDAWKNRGVIYCNMREVPFYESMPVEPEVVLADLIKVFHPAALPDYQPVYYHLLK